MANKSWISTSSTSFNTAANWSDGIAPANSDTLNFSYLGTANCTTNLGTVLTGLTINVEKSYTGQIGVLSGATATYLVIDGGTLNCGQNTGGTASGQGCPQVMVDFGSTAATVNSYDSASQSTSNYYPPTLVKGSSLTVNVTGGSIGVAALVGETATLTAMTVSKGNGSVSPSIYLGAGVTTTALTGSTGNILSRSNQTQTTVTLSGDASYEVQGTGATTTLTVGAGATTRHKGTGTITTLNLVGTFDRSSDQRALTVSTTNLYKGARYLLNNGKLSSTTRTTKNLLGCYITDVTIELPYQELF